MTTIHGDTPDERAAHLAYEAQLIYTAQLITDELEHRHFADDCGDYLKAALRLSSLMADARMDGTAALLLDAMRGLLDETPEYEPVDGDTPYDRTTLRLDYAGDGVCAALTHWAEAELERR